MADPKCVSAKCVIKSIFDKDLSPAVLKQMKQTIQKVVDKNSGLEFKDSCKEGYLLTVTLVSLTVDDEDKPDGLEAKVSIVGIAMGGTATGFNATGSSKVQGINPKKMEEEAKFIVDDALAKLMTKQVIPQMLKP
jgi:hypothetical protein